MKFKLSLVLMFLVTIGFLSLAAVKESQEKGNEKSLDMTIYQFTMMDINGESFELSSLKGNVVLIVNVASECGFTPQYEGLQELYKINKDKGLVVIGVPSNDFLQQEPGSNEDIKKFCRVNYGITFPMMAKVKVNGEDAAPLYKFLTDKSIHPKTGGDISWNFNKFLIDKRGVVVKRYSSFTNPNSSKIIRDLKKYLDRYYQL